MKLLVSGKTFIARSDWPSVRPISFHAPSEGVSKFNHKNYNRPAVGKLSKFIIKLSLI